MWQVLVLAWLGLFAVVAIFALQAFGYDFARLSALYSALPANQRLATGAIAFMAISLIAATIVLAGRLSRQQKQLRLLRDRLKGTREDIVVAHALQNHFDAALQHLVDSDPDQAISSIQKRLADTEQQAVAQAGLTEATDLQDQLSAIRRRQKDLRETVGEVAEKRRAIEPLFAELRDRQRQLERSVTELETDDNKNGLAIRLKELDQDVSAILARLGAVQVSYATLNRFKEQLGKAQAELVPLRAPEGGINGVIVELRMARSLLSHTLDELEKNSDEPLSSRVEALSRGKLEIEQRVARVDDEFNILNAIRLDFEELGERQAHLQRSLADVETDSSGKSLTDRQNALNEFVIESRLRLRALQDAFTTLNQYKKEMAESQAGLVPLPVFGIEALIREAHAIRDLLSRTLGEIELSGDQKLSSRVEALSKSKREIEDRIADAFENFTTLDALRKDIGGLFTTIRNTLNRIG
jgi:predicted  nucleic acid-binding Zn-ribbon protein